LPAAGVGRVRLVVPGPEMPVDVLLFLREGDRHHAGNGIAQRALSRGDNRQSCSTRHTDEHHRLPRIQMQYVPGGLNDPFVVGREPCGGRRLLLAEMRHVIMGVEADDRITQRDQVTVGVEILPVHAPITRGKDQERRRGTLDRAAIRVREMEPQAMAVQRDRAIGDDRAGASRAAPRRAHRQQRTDNGKR